LREMQWRRRQRDQVRDTEKESKAHEFAEILVCNLMPSFRFSKFQFRGMQPKVETISLEFEDLSLELKNGQRVLKGVTGNFGAGKMCAIMGPSGAGKTTFMNTLCGKANYGTMGGTVRVNGKDTTISKFRSVTGFVPQDDIVFEDLTVREQIYFSARLRNDVSTSENKIKHIVNDVLNIMQIDHIQNTIVGGVEQRGISGGQRKRVNISLELAAQPTLLFLDEPTSGLDATSSLAVALSLKTLCGLGMTSIMVIHQPRYSLFTLFDDVLLLGKGGRTVYLGDSRGAKRYFEHLGFAMAGNENPADWFMDVISGEVKNAGIAKFEPAKLFDMWDDNESFPAVDHDESGPRLRRTLTFIEATQMDRAVLTASLQEEFARIDPNLNFVINEDDLSLLLTRLAGAEPGETVVRELMDRMAGPDAETVSKSQFLELPQWLERGIARQQRRFRKRRKRGLACPRTNAIEKDARILHADEDLDDKKVGAVVAYGSSDGVHHCPHPRSHFLRCFGSIHRRAASLGFGSGSVPAHGAGIVDGRFLSAHLRGRPASLLARAGSWHKRLGILPVARYHQHGRRRHADLFLHRDLLRGPATLCPLLHVGIAVLPRLIGCVCLGDAGVASGATCEGGILRDAAYLHNLRLARSTRHAGGDVARRPGGGNCFQSVAYSVVCGHELLHEHDNAAPRPDANGS